jgi:hypothetical protein
MMDAMAKASSRFLSAGVKLDWHSEASDCKGRPDAMVVSFRAMTPKSFHPGALAYAFPYEGVHIEVFYDRIAQADPALLPSLMANVIVHEMTHILQGIDRHSASGVMKALWTSSDYTLMKRGLLRFKARVYMCFGCAVNPWTNHLRAGLDLIRRAFDTALETGDLLQVHRRGPGQRFQPREPLLQLAPRSVDHAFPARLQLGQAGVGRQALRFRAAEPLGRVLWQGLDGAQGFELGLERVDLLSRLAVADDLLLDLGLRGAERAQRRRALGPGQLRFLRAHAAQLGEREGGAIDASRLVAQSDAQSLDP